MSRVYWDTMLFVYWLEAHPKLSVVVERVYKRMVARGDQLCTSVFTVGELLAGPYKLGEIEKARRLRSFFDSPEVDLIPFTLEAAEQFGLIRGKHRVKPPDAIHLACAAVGRIDLVLTMDDQLRKALIPGVPLIASPTEGPFS